MRDNIRIYRLYHKKLRVYNNSTDIYFCDDTVYLIPLQYKEFRTMDTAATFNPPLLPIIITNPSSYARNHTSLFAETSAKQEWIIIIQYS